MNSPGEGEVERKEEQGTGGNSEFLMAIPFTTGRERKGKRKEEQVSQITLFLSRGEGGGGKEGEGGGKG